MIGNNSVPPNNLRLRFVYYSTDEQGERNRNRERENGEEIYTKNIMKLEGVQVKSNSVL